MASSNSRQCRFPQLATRTARFSQRIGRLPVQRKGDKTSAHERQHKIYPSRLLDSHPVSVCETRSCRLPQECIRRRGHHALRHRMPRDNSTPRPRSATRICCLVTAFSPILRWRLQSTICSRRRRDLPTSGEPWRQGYQGAGQYDLGRSRRGREGYLRQHMVDCEQHQVSELSGELESADRRARYYIAIGAFIPT